ncbi:2-C-methyl-D-erythritol 4-phosphate cytidylyltransferase [Defluviitalea saccharophila]|uniref:2-C-methyl-D-erythritol 4-phosphate cytidylyltransferase n=1 Tax=Defluviitalea saccharophila TaxID=879970 RepID=A0ABZ2Y4U4_9FIRM|nr:2-C-methyl-D-erythritol 4-phosphate cytidylyltransferase [Candidatus Epulonipiscium sp.]
MDNNFKYTTVIIPAAGKGKRMGTQMNKQYLELGGKPIIVHTIEKFDQSPRIHEIIIVTSKEEMEYFKKEIVSKYHFNKPLKVVAGGKERQESVYNGLKNISPEAEIILIHDGARPFVSLEEIEKSVEGAREYGSCVIGVRVKDTIKICNEEGYIESTPRREGLWAVQTPQSFQTSIILEAHKKAEEDHFLGTDDATLVERLGYPIKILEGGYQNIKITTPDDLTIGEVILSKRS